MIKAGPQYALERASDRTPKGVGPAGFGASVDVPNATEIRPVVRMATERSLERSIETACQAVNWPTIDAWYPKVKRAGYPENDKSPG